MEQTCVVEKNNGEQNITLELFHGTSSTDPQMIYQGEDGFDMRFSRSGMWGQGIYFAVNASYSTNYSYSTALNGQAVCIVCTLSYLS